MIVSFDTQIILTKFRESVSFENATLYGTVFESAIFRENTTVSCYGATLDYVHLQGVRGLTWRHNYMRQKLIRFS